MVVVSFCRCLSTFSLSRMIFEMSGEHQQQLLEVVEELMRQVVEEVALQLVQPTQRVLVVLELLY